MISTSPDSDLAGAIARAGDLLLKATVADDEPAAHARGSALADLRTLHEALTRPTSDEATTAAMKAVSA